MTSAAHASLAVAAHASLASAAHTSLAARYEQPSPPRFTAFGVDLERPGALELVTRQIAHQREIILVCGDAAPTAGSATHVRRAAAPHWTNGHMQMHIRMDRI